MSAVVDQWGRWVGIARPEQLPPPEPWRHWTLFSDRGWGKTRAVIEYLASWRERPDFTVYLLTKDFLVRHTLEQIMDVCDGAEFHSTGHRVQFGPKSFVRGFDVTDRNLELRGMKAPTIVWIEEVYLSGLPTLQFCVDRWVEDGARLIATRGPRAWSAPEPKPPKPRAVDGRSVYARRRALKASA
jgi:hypothetical protein